MDQRNQPRRNPTRPVPAGTTLLSALILGICLIIAGASVSGAVKKLTAAVKEQTFAYNAEPVTAITVKNAAPKNYYTETEAAAYLNVTPDEIKAAISRGDIDEYILTSAGYSISQSALDDYFEDQAYAIQLERNSSSSDE